MKEEVRKLAEETREVFEQLAVEHANQQGFDYINQPNGLFAVFIMAMVYNEGELLKKAARIVAERHK